MKMKQNATSHTMRPILPSTPTQHRDSMRKITHTHTHTHTHVRTHARTHARTRAHARTHAVISYESNRSQAYI